jgi:hypothetical protein
MTTAEQITAVCADVREMLLAKNAAYGDSALDPVRVFSKASTVEQILVRIDDKLSRLSRGAPDGEDIERDLIGYLILLRIARARAAKTSEDAVAPGHRPGFILPMQSDAAMWKFVNSRPRPMQEVIDEMVAQAVAKALAK